MSVPVWQAALLGVVQGLTEFLPVSSTAHLALVQRFLPGFSQPGILFDVMLHVGTLAAVLVFFRGRLGEIVSGALSDDAARRSSSRRLVLFLLLAVAATGAVALPLKKLAVEGMSDFRAMGAALCATALVLSVAQRLGARRGERGLGLAEMTAGRAAAIGLCQALSAVFHGFSRSGNTIAVGLFTGLSRRAAAEFSFLLSIPTILAAAAVENLSAYRHGTLPFASAAELPAYVVGMLVAALVGYAAIAALLRLVVAMRLVPFILYCGVLGLFLLTGRVG